MGTLKKYQSPPYVQERPLELFPFTPLSNPANAQGPSLRSAAGAKFWMIQNLRLVVCSLQETERGTDALISNVGVVECVKMEAFLLVYKGRHPHW